MKSFTHFDAYSVEEAVSLLDRYNGKAAVMAGGTDLLGKMKDRVLPDYPEALVNIKTIPGLDNIAEAGGVLRIGALATLDQVTNHPVVREEYLALSQAAGRVGSPQLRNMGTIAGNICQDIRCWYYRASRNRFSCLRKGGGRCYALDGDSRFHSIFGGSVEGGCIAVHPSDTAPALVALGARDVGGIDGSEGHGEGSESRRHVGDLAGSLREPGSRRREILLDVGPEGGRLGELDHATAAALVQPCASSLSPTAAHAQRR